jgi:hypothetical protein
MSEPDIHVSIALKYFQIGYITVDNAESDTTAMDKLHYLLGQRELSFSPSNNCLQCLARIIDICSFRTIAAFSPKSPTDASLLTDPLKDGSSVADNASKREGDVEPLVMNPWNDSEVEYDSEPDLDLDPKDSQELCDLTSKGAKWSAGLKRNPLERARRVIYAIQSSDSTKQKFSQTINDGNLHGWFPARDKNGELIPGKVAKLENLPLLKDVKTSWDSVYLMLRRLRDLRGVCFIKTIVTTVVTDAIFYIGH